MDCSKPYEKKLDEDILKGFQNAQKIGDEDLEKFSFMLCKGAYPEEYMDNWEKFNETSL